MGLATATELENIREGLRIFLRRDLIAVRPEQWRSPQLPRFQRAGWWFPKRPQSSRRFRITSAPIRSSHLRDRRPALSHLRRLFLQSIFQQSSVLRIRPGRSACRSHSVTAVCRVDRRRDFRNRGPPRLLRRLARDALPALHPLLRSPARDGPRCAARPPGTIRTAPSSTHFSMAHSMRSNLKMERTRVRLGIDGTGMISPSSNSTRSSVMLAMRPRRTHHQWRYQIPARSGPRSTCARCRACAPTKAARLPETSSAIQRRRVIAVRMSC